MDAELLLVTHEHTDHNGVEAIGGEPVTLRSTAGRLESPIGEVLAVASEHDAAAGTERGPNTIAIAEQVGALDRPDALPHSADQLPQNRRTIP